MHYFFILILLSTLALFGDDSKQFDVWNYWIGNENHFTESEDRNISTKISQKNIYFTLASINKDDNAYELKDADNANANNKVEIAIYTNEQDPSKVSTTINWDPTDSKYINKSTAALTVDGAYKDLIVGMRMCATYNDDEKHYVLYEWDQCDNSSDKDCDYDTTTSSVGGMFGGDSSSDGDPVFTICYASNNFAIRPKYFDITKKDTHLIADKILKFSTIAKDSDDEATPNYTITNKDVDDADSAVTAIKKLFNSWINGSTNTETTDYNLTVEITKYMPNDDENSSLYGEGDVGYYRFKDGDASLENDRYVEFYYDEVGKIQYHLMDQNWSDVDKDDTPATCSNEEGENMGRFICGDVNQTYIPSHFHITDVTLHDNNDSTFTYISNDLNQSASITLHIEAQNEQNNTTRNFDYGSWEQSLAITFITSKEQNILKHTIEDKIEFEDGNKTIIYSESNVSRKLLFNYERNISKALNPFKIEDVNISVLADYGDINITEDGEANATNSGEVTFLYARAHILRHRFVKASEYTLPIYYEVYCDGDGNKTLLPNGDDSNVSDDPRWYINTKHNSSFGEVKVLEQKYATTRVTQKSISLNSLVLEYDSSRGYPYKATINIYPSSWLIYNKYNYNAKANDFEVELENNTKSDSVGQKETNATTKAKATLLLNRRTLW